MFILILAIIIGTVFSSGLLSSEPPHVYPEFQPGIWDKPVIQFPENSSAGMNDYPFMFGFELNASSGFENVYRKFYRPTFVLAHGRTGTIGINITSYSTTPLNVTLKRADDLPKPIGIAFVPATVFLRPGESRMAQVVLNASGDLSGPAGTVAAENEQEIPVGLWLKAGNWSIGQGFYLKLVPQ